MKEQVLLFVPVGGHLVSLMKFYLFATGHKKIQFLE